MSKSAGTPPSPRWLGAMVYDPLDNYTLLFGGYGGTGVASADSDTWSFAHNQWTPQSGASGPSARYAASIAWDPTDGYAVLFGGYSGTGVYFNDTWSYVHGTWNNISGTTNQTPPARWRAAMTWDAADGYAVMFGGTNAAGTAYTDTWSFVHHNWTKLTVSGSPPGRYRASMTWDPLGNVAVLFGGCTATCPDSSTWTYRNLTWTGLSLTTHPGARVYYGFTYSPIAKTDILFGGSSAVSNSPLSDTWNYTNGTWASLTPSLSKSPTAVAYLMMAFDPVDGYTVMFGGQYVNLTYSNATWVLGPSIIDSVAITPPAIDFNQTVKVNATPFAFSKWVNYNYTGLPPGCAAGNVSNFTCRPTLIGSYPISVTLNDSLGVPVVRNGTIVVHPDPVIAQYTVDFPSVTVGSKATLHTSVTNGTGTYSYHYTNLPTGCTSANTANLSCTPSGTGSFTVQVMAQDAAAFQVFQNLTMLVNAKPAVTSLIALPGSLDVGQVTNLRTTLTGGTAPLTFVWTNLPTGCVSANTSTLACTPSAPYTNLVNVTATDSFGWNASSSVALLVSADPAISAAVALPAVFDVGSVVHIWANASGGTGALSYSYLNTPAGCTPANVSATSCTPLVQGTFNVTAEVTDSVGFVVRAYVSFTVNAAVTLAAVATTPGAIDAGQTVTFNATPSGGTAPFQYAYRGLPAGCPPSSVSGTITCSPSTPGSYTVSVTITDGSAKTAANTGTLVVHPDPSVSLVPSTATPTVGTSFQILANASNGSAVYTYQYAGLPTGCSGANTSTLTCDPTAAGTFVIQVTVTDSLKETASSSANVTVGAKPSTALLGLSPLVLYGVIALVAIVVVAAVALLLMRKRSPTKPKRATPAADEPWAEDGAPPKR
ncbi:MAG TPA: kelch repeat-containing protein [Thermoplasmata archaeon]|nr:kelch repeat-containing protein [Thermoplasmata archaeon]